MSAGSQRRWSAILLALLGLTLAGAVTEALAACGDCCHEMPARPLAPCQSAVSIQCCDGALALPAMPPAPQQPLQALSTAPLPTPLDQPVLRSSRLATRPPLLCPSIRSVVLRL